VKQAVESGYSVCVITGGDHIGVKLRLGGLGVKEVHLGVKDKVAVLKHFLEEQNLQRHQVAYMGDDLPDLEAMKLVGFTSCPQNAVPEIKEVCSYVSHLEGGAGCVRDLIEQVMRVQQKWPGQKST